MKKYFLIIGLAIGVMLFSHAAYASSGMVTAQLQNADLSANGCAFFQVSAISSASASGNITSVGNTINGNNPVASSWNPSSCLRVGLNDSVFTTDFRIGGQMADVGCGSICWGPLFWTNWASDIAAGANPIGPMVGSSDSSHWVQMRIFVQTRPLDPTKEIVANLGVTLFEFDRGAPIGVPTDPASLGTRPFVFTPNGGGWTVFNTACGHAGSVPRCSGVGGTSNSPNEFEFRLNATEQPIAPPAAGTIKVSSVNSKTGGSVASSWKISGPSGNVCGASNCTNLTSGSYSASVGGPYNLTPQGTPAGYSFDNSEILPIATRQGFWGNLLSLASNLAVPAARAWTISPAASQSILSSGGSIAFTIKWDPEAVITVNPTSLSGSGSFTITNSGKPGSTLVWNAVSNKGCAVISTPNGTANQGVSDTENVTVTGACSTTITVSGTSQPSGNSVPSKTVTISAVGPVAPTVNLTANPGTIKLYGSTTLTWTVTNATACTASASPAENDWNGAKASTGGSQLATPAVIGKETYSITCTGPGGSTPKSVTVTVNNPAAMPNCSIGANPVSIVVPQTSTIAYNCKNIQPQDACSLTGSDGVNYPVARTSTVANGTQAVGPTQNTSYTISCQDPNNAGVSASATVSVSVTNPNQGECPPQGCTP